MCIRYSSDGATVWIFYYAALYIFNFSNVGLPMQLMFSRTMNGMSAL